MHGPGTALAGFASAGLVSPLSQRASEAGLQAAVRVTRESRTPQGFFGPASPGPPHSPSRAAPDAHP
jgi:hypothetical protein